MKVTKEEKEIPAVVEVTYTITLTADEASALESILDYRRQFPSWPNLTTKQQNAMSDLYMEL